MTTLTAFSADDVVTAEFADENTSVLFLPHSGEVISCTKRDWNQLLQGEVGHTSELAETLSNLGVLVA